MVMEAGVAVDLDDNSSGLVQGTAGIGGDQVDTRQTNSDRLGCLSSLRHELWRDTLANGLVVLRSILVRGGLYCHDLTCRRDRAEREPSSLQCKEAVQVDSELLYTPLAAGLQAPAVLSDDELPDRALAVAVDARREAPHDIQ